jgi:CDP-4-dehydro-6-deoxyglucose reductase, E3
LSAEEEASGFMLACCATPVTDLTLENKQVAAAGQFPVGRLPVRITQIHRAASDVAVLTLQLPANASFQYHAGQYVEFLLRDGARRAYSMATAPHQGQTSVELHIRHMPGGKFTDHVFGAMKEKDVLRIEGPYGSFFLREESNKPIVLLASGTGLAPIKAVIEHMQAKGMQRPVRLYWGCRHRDDLYLDAWAREAVSTLPQLEYVPVLSEPRPEDHWTGRTGLVHQAVMADLPSLAGHQVYACGAPIMVESAQRDFTERCGLPTEEFFADSFTSEADKAREGG